MRVAAAAVRHSNGSAVNLGQRVQTLATLRSSDRVISLGTLCVVGDDAWLDLDQLRDEGGFAKGRPLLLPHRGKVPALRKSASGRS